MFKNTAGKLTVLAFADNGHATLDAGEPVTGDAANITCKVEQDDDGTRDALADTNPTETEDGQYVFDVAQAEANGDKLTFYPQSSTAGVQVVALPSNVIYTRPPNFGNLGIEPDGDLTKVNTLHGHTPQTADHTAAIADVPTTSEFEARTLPAADYFDPDDDAVTVGDGGYVDGFVHLADTDGNAGTTVGVNGTIENPCNSWSDASAVALARGLKKIRLLGANPHALGDIEPLGSFALSLFEIDLNGTQVSYSDAASVNSCYIHDGTIRALSPRFDIKSNLVENVLFYAGTINVSSAGTLKNCQVTNLQFTASLNSPWMTWHNCGTYQDPVGGQDHFSSIDYNNFDNYLRLPGWYGDIQLTNMTDANSVLEVYGWGKVTIADSCTAGIVRVTSHMKVLNENGDIYDGDVTIDFVSHPGGVDSFSGDAEEAIGNITKLGGSEQALTNLKNSSLAILTGAVVAADSTANSATSFDTDLSQETENYYGNSDGGLVLAFVSGTTNAIQTRRIISSVDSGANTRLTVEAAFDDTPADADAFVLLGRITELN